jgi:hypothetical protein
VAADHDLASTGAVDGIDDYHVVAGATVDHVALLVAGVDAVVARPAR